VPQPPPPGQQPNASDLRTVVISVDANHNYTINTDPIGLPQMGDRLTQIFATRAERVVFVKGADDVEFQWVAQAIDVAHGAGIDKVGLLLADQSGQ